MSVWQKQKNWWNEVLWKPKKALSLDQLKFQHHMLLKNPVVTDHNKQLLVETFRSIAEILIWGDQNDSRVFDFFLEKNMQAFFLKTLSQKCGCYVCVQLLQTLNILFENIRNETAIYYLLSNNHINSIIVLKLDFSQEEVLAYYISFLKTLSFHLNKHTIHFFYNEHLRDFPLYTEAIKFFKHSENMVRIAVRTLTLNVYKVEDKATLDYICNKTAAPYFSNLAWFIGNHVIELDECLISQAHHLNRGRLEQLVAEHLDHLHYISDIFSLGVQCLNGILSDHFLNRLLIPLYIYSLVDEEVVESEEKNPRISSTVALFLLSQVFLILSHSSLVTPLAYLMFTGDTSLTLPPILQGHKRGSSYNSVCAFVQPESSLETSLVRHSSQVHANPISMSLRGGGGAVGGASHKGSEISSASFASQNSVEGYVDTVVDDQYVVIEASPSGSGSSLQSSQPISNSHSPSSPSKSRSPRQQARRASPTSPKSLPARPPPGGDHHGIPIVNGNFLSSLMSSLIIQHDDSKCLFGLGILYAMLNNKGIHHKLLEAFSLRPKAKTKGNDEGSPRYNSELVALLLSILDSCTSASNSIRLVTLRLAIMLLTELLAGSGGGKEEPKTSSEKPTPEREGGVEAEGTAKLEVEGDSDVGPILQDHHIALVEHIYESAILRLRLYYKGPKDEVFLDMFEDEYEKEKSFKLKVSFLMMDETMLLPPTNTPLTGIDFTRRLPCGEHEKARKAMRVFFAMRMLSQQMSGEKESLLPLTNVENSAKPGEVVDMSNCDLVSCKMIVGEKTTPHFMVFNETEFLLVDPDQSKLGHGVVHFIAFLQDIDISGDPADAHSLYVVVHNRNSTQKRPKLSGKFVFEDHIRCGSAKRVFQRARDHLHHSKMTRIAKMLHLPIPDSPSAVPMANQQDQLADATPPTLTTPTISIPEATFTDNAPHISASIVQDVFRGASPVNTSAQSQEIELSSLTTPERDRQLTQLGGEMPPFDTPIRLTLPAPLFDATGAGMFPRDTSATPEPSSRSSVERIEDSEEALTVNGGFRYHDSSSLLSSVDAGMLDQSWEGENAGVADKEEVCPSGEVGPVLDRLDATGESVVASQRESSQPCYTTKEAQPVVDFSPTDDVQVSMVDTPAAGHAQEGSSQPQHDEDMLGLTSAIDSWMKGTPGYSTLASTDTPSIGDSTVTPCYPDGDQGNERVQPLESEHALTSTEHAQLIPTNPAPMGVSAPHTSHVATGSEHTEHAENIEHHLMMDSGCLATEQHLSVDKEQSSHNTESSEHLHRTQTATERDLCSDITPLVDLVAAAHAEEVPEQVEHPLRTSSEQSVLSSKSATSMLADVSMTPDSSRVVVTAETGERTPPSADNSANLLH